MKYYYLGVIPKHIGNQLNIKEIQCIHIISASKRSMLQVPFVRTTTFQRQLKKRDKIEIKLQKNNKIKNQYLLSSFSHLILKIRKIIWVT